MNIISEWKKRPHKYHLKDSEVMVEVIIGGVTKHIKIERRKLNENKT
jgi:hypothetical protein